MVYFIIQNKRLLKHSFNIYECPDLYSEIWGTRVLKFYNIKQGENFYNTDISIGNKLRTKLRNQIIADIMPVEINKSS